LLNLFGNSRGSTTIKGRDDFGVGQELGYIGRFVSDDLKIPSTYYPTEMKDLC